MQNNTKSVELMIKVEAFNIFLTETQGFPIAWLVPTTSLAVALRDYMIFCLSPHFANKVTNGVCSLGNFATDESLRYETQKYFLNSNKHLISASSPCISL